jgi:hypothetical protein
MSRTSYLAAQMLYVVLQEVYSVGVDGGQRFTRRSAQPLFAGDRLAAHSFAKQEAGKFESPDYHDGWPNPFFWGRDVVKREVHRFIIKPAMPG